MPLAPSLVLSASASPASILPLLSLLSLLSLLFPPEKRVPYFNGIGRRVAALGRWAGKIDKPAFLIDIPDPLPALHEHMRGRAGVFRELHESIASSIEPMALPLLIGLLG